MPISCSLARNAPLRSFAVFSHNGLDGAVDIKLDYGLDGTTTLQLQCRLAGTADFFNEMPTGRYFNFATIVPSGRHFSHYVNLNTNAQSPDVILFTTASLCFSLSGSPTTMNKIGSDAEEPPTPGVAADVCSVFRHKLSSNTFPSAMFND